MLQKKTQEVTSSTDRKSKSIQIPNKKPVEIGTDLMANEGFNIALNLFVNKCYAFLMTANASKVSANEWTEFKEGFLREFKNVPLNVLYESFIWGVKEFELSDNVESVKRMDLRTLIRCYSRYKKNVLDFQPPKPKKAIEEKRKPDQWYEEQVKKYTLQTSKGEFDSRLYVVIYDYLNAKGRLNEFTSEIRLAYKDEAKKNYLDDLNRRKEESKGKSLEETKKLHDVLKKATEGIGKKDKERLFIERAKMRIITEYLESLAMFL